MHKLACLFSTKHSQHVPAADTLHVGGHLDVLHNTHLTQLTALS